MEKLTLSDIKKNNYKDVFLYLYKEGKAAKQTIANALHMSLPTVTQHLKELQEEHLIQQSGQFGSQIGRKATAYTICTEARIAIGAEISAERIHILALNLYGQPILESSTLLEFENSYSYCRQFALAVDSFVEKLQVPKEYVIGIGISLQAFISRDYTSVTEGIFLDCNGLSTHAFQKYLFCPCCFIQDTECAVLAELFKRPEVKTAIYLSIGTHLGGTIIIDRAVLKGENGNPSHLEHMALHPGGRSCYCGRNGCMAAYCSLHSLLGPSETLDFFFQNKNIGEKYYVMRWRKFLTELALAINNLHMIIHCEIILGGSISSYLLEDDLAFLHAEIKTLSGNHDNDLFISKCSCTDHAVSIGAAIPYLKDFLNSF